MCCACTVPTQAHEQLAGLVKKGASLRSVQVLVDAISRHSHLHRLTLSAPSGDMYAPCGHLLIHSACQLTPVNLLHVIGALR